MPHHHIDALPKTMLAIEIVGPGGPEKLKPTQFVSVGKTAIKFVL